MHYIGHTYIAKQKFFIYPQEAIKWSFNLGNKSGVLHRIQFVASGGQKCSGPTNRLPARNTLWVSLVALELRSNVEVDYQGVPGRYILHRVGPCTKVDKRKALIGCLSWHRMLCMDDAHTMSIRMVWVKCTTSAECKSVRIVESSVMDGCDGHT
jgi:hypothetical protein